MDSGPSIPLPYMVFSRSAIWFNHVIQCQSRDKGGGGGGRVVAILDGTPNNLLIRFNSNVCYVTVHFSRICICA